MLIRCAPLLACAGALAWGQSQPGVSTIPADPIFRSDTQDPKRAGGAGLLETVCPGRVVVAERIACKGGCPSFTELRVGGLELVGVTRGHFLSTSSDDAALSTIGCEPHAANYGGTILLTRQTGSWSMVWYRAGADTSKCHKVTVENPREILVCVGTYGGQGYFSTALDVEDLAAGEERGFLSVSDNTGAMECGTNFRGDRVPLVRGGIEKVEFGISADGRPLVLVTAFTGQKWLNNEEVETCEDMRSGAKPRHELNIFPATKTYHLEFFFDGHDFKPTPESADAARLFAQ